MGKPHILIVEDDEVASDAACELLTDDGFAVTAQADAESAVSTLLRIPFAAILVDYQLPGINGIAFIREARKVAPAVPCIVITGYGDVPTTVSAMQAGAFSFVEKPLNPELLLEVVRTACQRHAGIVEVDRLRRQLNEKYGLDNIVGNSPAMRAVFHQVRLAAESNVTILIRGDSGTGKELIARAIHQNSPRKNKPFVAVNCAALPESLVESELFGHEKGAFTGAAAAKQGYFEAANLGTLFIDEIGDMPLGLQAKLLRALELKVITRIGSTKEIPVDVRIVAATHRKLDEMVGEERFREDLYYRVSVVKVELPPLRARHGDMPLLVAYFIDQLSSEHGREVHDIAPEALDLLVHHSWPGNVRELRNAIEHSIVLNRADRIEAAHLPSHIRNPDSLVPDFGATLEPKDSDRVSGSPAETSIAPGEVRTESKSLAEIERLAILTAMERAGGNRTRAAQALDIGLRTIQRKLKEYGYGEGD